jgi:hypothetical protein
MKKSIKKAASGAARTKRKTQLSKDNKHIAAGKGSLKLKAQQLKQALLAAISDEDIKQIEQKLIAQAKEGDIRAAKEIFDRIWGRAPMAVDVGDNTRKTIYDILAVCGLSGLNDNVDNGK